MDAGREGKKRQKFEEQMNSSYLRNIDYTASVCASLSHDLETHQLLYGAQHQMHMFNVSHNMG